LGCARAAAPISFAIALVGEVLALLTIAWLMIASAVSLQPDTTVVLGLVERDLTGDGAPETLRVVGVGPTIDNLDATFTIESAGKTVYRFKLEPLTRTVGFDAGRQVLSAEQHRTRLTEFRQWFFAEEKFQRPSEFVDSLRVMARLRVPEIPDVIARDTQPSDTRDGDAIWEEILNSPVTIFTFSPGGDVLVAIGWSARAGRFYRLLACC
jgi:hypothetical protein